MKAGGLATQQAFINVANLAGCRKMRLEGKKPHLGHYIQWVWKKSKFPLASLLRLKIFQQQTVRRRECAFSLQFSLLTFKREKYRFLF